MRRKLFFVPLVALLLAAGFGAASFPALAELRVITITLQGGQRITTTVDVPPSTPVDQIQLPEITAPIEGVEENLPETDTTKPTPRHETEPRKADETVGKHEDIERTEAQPQVEEDHPEEKKERPDQSSGGVPTTADPSYSLALPGPAPIGVPSFVLEKFRIPPFLLPLYQAAGVQYGIRWEVLAAINEIETDYGRNLNVSSAGAVGWMQFIPSSWRMYGVDANKDGLKDPYNPVDAIFAAGRYLKAAGAGQDLRRAIFAYNHADWYVDSVLMRARLIAGMPADVVGSLTGLTQGHFPVHARARYTDDLGKREARLLGKRVRRAHNAAKVVDSDESRRSINIFSRKGSPVIAANDGVVKKVGEDERLGKHIVLQDVYGNRYLYAHLGSISKRYPVPRSVPEPRTAADEFHAARAAREAKLPRPTQPASAGRQLEGDRTGASAASAESRASAARKERLFAHPTRARSRSLAEQRGQDAFGEKGFEVFQVYFSRVFRLGPDEVRLKALKKGAHVVAGTVLGRIGKRSDGPGSKLAPHLNFSIRPAGRGAPRIDPKPILDGWRLLEATAVYRAAGKNPFFGPSADQPSVGQILLMSKEALARRVLADPHIDLYPCGRSDVRSGQIDRRVLAALEFLAASGLRPSVTSLKCGHGYYTASGNVSEHSSGNAVDIAKINGIPILGHQGEGSITEITIKRLLALQGTVQPHQVISLMEMGGPTIAMGDHADHIHLGFKPLFGGNEELGRQARRLLSNNQWQKLVKRIGDIRNPIVRTKPSRYSIRVRRHRASRAHAGE